MSKNSGQGVHTCLPMLGYYFKDNLPGEIFLLFQILIKNELCMCVCHRQCQNPGIHEEHQV